MKRRQFVAALTAGAVLPAAHALEFPFRLAQGQPARRGPEVLDRIPDVIFWPTPNEVVDPMLELAEVGPKDTVYDLGCGDGRIVITAAQRYGARGVGIDIDPQRIGEATANAKKAGVTDRVRFVEADLFEANISEATVVTLYLLPRLNVKLRPKLQSELKPGTRVVSHAFDMGDWAPEKRVQVGSTSVYLWKIVGRAGGVSAAPMPPTMVG